jgi:hypothetical protein
MKVARAVVRTFATAKNAPFLSDAIAKAAIGKDAEVATSFVSAFAPVVHQKRVRVADVSSLPETTGLSLVREMKHDIALRYSIGAESAVMEVVPQVYSRALVEIQQRPEIYLPGRALAHASGHYLAAINEEARAVKAEKRKSMDEVSLTEPKIGARKSKSKGADKVGGKSPVYTAYERVEPVHLLMLSNFCYAYDKAARMWRAPKNFPMKLSIDKYSWVAPLFSTFRLTTDAGSVRLDDGLDVDNPGLNNFASSLRERLTITIVHLPMVPLKMEDDDAWRKVATMPEHQEALESSELRQWLHFLAHTSIKDGKVDMPAELRSFPIFRKSAEMAENLLHSPGMSFSEKEMHDFTLQSEAAAAEERAVLREAAAEERAAAAKREEVLRAELELLKKKPFSNAS